MDPKRTAPMIVLIVSDNRLLSECTRAGVGIRKSHQTVYHTEYQS